MEHVTLDIEKMRKEKEYLIQKQQKYHKENEDRMKKIDNLQVDL